MIKTIIIITGKDKERRRWKLRKKTIINKSMGVHRKDIFKKKETRKSKKQKKWN